MGASILTRNSNITIPANNFYPIPFSNGDITPGMWIPSMPTKIFADVTGDYQLAAEVQWIEQSGGTRRVIAILWGGNPYVASRYLRVRAETPVTTLSYLYMKISVGAYMHAGEWVELVVAHNRSGGLTVGATPSMYVPRLSMFLAYYV